MSEPKRIGRRVFPNPESSEIRKSQQFLHYSKPILPPEEPPIDYTIKVKNDRDYKVVGDVFHRAPSTDFSREEDNLSSSRPRLQKQKSSTVEEILDELDNVLFEASIPFDELKKKVENFNLSFKPYAPEADLEEIQRNQRYTKEPIRIEPIRISRKERRDSHSNSIEILTLSSSSSSNSNNKNNEKKIEEMFRKTQKEITEAKAYFSPAYFQAQFELEGVPAWKRNLLADKKSKETVRRIEHDAWAKFERYKQSLAEKRQIRRSSSVQIGRSKK